MFLLPQTRGFFDDFDGLAAHAVGGGRELAKLSKEWPANNDGIRSLKEHERQADEIAHDALRRLDKTFQTPIYREDIHDLIHTLDSVIDTMKDVGERFGVFHIEAVRPAFIEQSEILVSATVAVEQAVRTLRKDRKLSALLEPIIEIHRQENKANDVHEAAMSALFGEPSDVLNVLKWKEVHELALRATDQCEDVANIIERIALQNG